MADEAQVRISLQINSGLLVYQSQPSAFSSDVSGSKGPTPGAIAVTTGGTDVSLSELTTPGWVRVMNLDASNYVEWGVWDPEGNAFFPVGELGPGEMCLFKFSRNFQEQYAGTGTSTTSATNRLRIKANTSPCNVLVEAFEA